MRFSKVRPVKVIMLGAGGTGGHIAPHLYRLLYALDRPVRFIICDGDVVEQKNLVRQNFAPADLGENKAKVLAERYASVFGMETEYVPEFIENEERLRRLLQPYSWQISNEYLREQVILIGAVDNNRSRQLCNTIFYQMEELIYIDSGNGEHTGQVDYVNPITDMHYVDAGLKYIFRQNASDSKYYDILGDGARTENQAMSSDYDQRQSIAAVYADYQLKWKKLGFKAGVRYEHTFTDVAYALTPERNFDAGFDDVVPSANLAYMITPASNLKLNYNMRINRPGIWYLNPFRDTSNPNVVSYGNPDLESEKSHNVSLTYGSFSAKFNINATLSYMFVNNGIEGYSFMNGDIMESTFRNVGKTKKARLSLWANWNPSVKSSCVWAISCMSGLWDRTRP